MSSRRTLLLTTEDSESQLAHVPTSFSALLAYLESLYCLSASRLQLFDSKKVLITDDDGLQKAWNQSRSTPTMYVEKSLIGLSAQRPPAVDYAIGFSGISQLRMQQVKDHSVTYLISQGMNWTGRAFLYPPDWILFTGGQDHPKSACLISIPDKGVKTVSLQDMNHARVWHGLCVIGGTAYAVGGKDPETGSPLKSTEMLVEAQWTLLGPLTRPRESLAVIAHKEVVYAVGGFDGNTRLDTIESMRRGKWAELPVRLPEPRQMPGLVFLTESQLMVVGGQDDTRAKRSVFLIDVESRKVETLPQLPVPDYFTGRQLIKKESGEVWGFGKQTYIYFPSLRMWATAPSPTRCAPPSS